MMYRNCISRGRNAGSARSPVIALIVLAALGLMPVEAVAGCTFGMSRMPAATAPSPAPAPTYRANMLRAKPVAAKPRHIVKRKPRPQVASNAAARPHGVRKARPKTKLAARPAAPRAAATPTAPPGARPTPLVQAQWEAATPKAYALVETTVCETEPGTRLAMLRTPDSAAAPPEQGVELPLTPPGGDTPPPAGPDILLPPVTPPTGGPGIIELTPPGPPGGPPTGPPLGPPGPPIVAPVPEPSTWVMLIFGFGATGWMIRRRTSRLRLQVTRPG